MLVLREQAAAVRGHALRVRGATAAAAAAWGIRLLLRVQEPPACSPSSLHRVQMPRLVEVWLHTRTQTHRECHVSKFEVLLLFMLGKKALAEMNESDTDS